MNLSVPAILPVADNYNNNSFSSADHKSTTESTPGMPENLSFIAQNGKTPCQVADYNLINFLNEFWSPPVTVGYNQQPQPQNLL